MSRTWWMACVLVSAVMAPGSVRAQSQPTAEELRTQIEQLRKDFDARLAALEARLTSVEQNPAPAAAVPATAPGAVETAGAGALPVYGAGSAASKVFNPDTAVIGNFIGAGGDNDHGAEPAFEMAESEVSFQAVVDPYARADFFISFGEHGVDLEEGFATFSAVPGGLLVKAGKMRADFGKVNTLHSHVIPWVDRPLVTENLVGGEEGISDAGVSAARLISNPWFFLEATGQVYRGDSDNVFVSTRRSDLGYVGHLRGYQDVSESTNIDLGASYAHGHNASGLVNGIDTGRFVTDLFGVDATVRWRPLRRSIYRSFLGRVEWVRSQREQPDGLQTAQGFYVSGDYQFARRWFAGARLDRSDRADAATLHDQGGSFLITYRPSEFSQLRGQFRRTAYAEGVTANELLFQLQFAIGAHGAHPF